MSRVSSFGLGNENPHAEARKFKCSECGSRPDYRDVRWKYDTAREGARPGSGWVHRCRDGVRGRVDKTLYGVTYDPE